MEPKSWAAEVADLEPLDEDATAWTLLARCPVDAEDRQALRHEVGAMLRSLRERAGLTQKELASHSAGLHQPLVGEWERGEHFGLFSRHAPYLINAVGIRVLDLVACAETARGFGADFDERVVAGINAHLQEVVDQRAAARAAGDHAEVARLESSLGALPTLEELAERIGLEMPLSRMDAVALSRAVVASGVKQGWTIGRK